MQSFLQFSSRSSRLWLVVFTWLVVLAITLSCQVSFSSKSNVGETQTAVAVQQTNSAATSTAQQATNDASNAEATRKAQQAASDLQATQAAMNLQLTMQAQQTSQPTTPPASSGGSSTSYTTEFDSTDGWKTKTVPETDDNNYEAYTQGGQLYMQIQPEGVTLYTFYETIFPIDMNLGTYAQKVEGPNTNNISLICRATDLGWYEFAMTSGGYWYIWLYNDGDYDILAKGASMAINMKNAANKLNAACIGDTLTFWINDVEVGSVTDRTFINEGQLGIGIYSEYPGLGVEFEWFAAEAP